MPEIPANGGLSRIGSRSLGSEFGRFRSQIADSLWRLFEIFPFFGDGDRRPGSIRHCMADLAVYRAISAMVAGKLLVASGAKSRIVSLRSLWSGLTKSGRGHR